MWKTEGLDPLVTSSESLMPRMAYLVKITLRAERDLTTLFWVKNAEYSEAALKWYLALKNAVFSLHFSQLAESCSAGLQTGCPEGLPALRNLARP